MTGDRSRHSTYAIIGAGFGGIGMAVRLKQAEMDDFVVFERAAEVGGTWRENTYPGCACDVESQLYSFSFAQHPEWSRVYSPSAEIQSYLVGCADRFGVRAHVRFGHEVQKMTWEEATGAWRLETSQGSWTAEFVILAMGPLSEPLVPDLPGLKTFQGKVFHSAQWDHGYDLKDKRVAVIGTGASAIQFVPAIQPFVSKLLLFQRTPPWVVARIDRAFTEAEKEKFRKTPRVMKARRLWIFVQREILGTAFRWPVLLRVLRHLALKHMARAVKSPELRAKLTPSYKLGCKRVLISNNYYPALVKPNVEVVTAGVKEVRAGSVVDGEGNERPVDALIFGTGFHVTDFPNAQMIVGRGGRNLGDEWQGSPKAFIGTTMAGYPNMFGLLGPNTGLGHSSVILMMEAQMDQIVKVLEHVRVAGYKTLDVRPEVQERFNQWIQAKSAGTVWVSGGCKSWYQDPSGRNSAIWPASVPSFQRRMRRFATSDYRFS